MTHELTDEEIDGLARKRFGGAIHTEASGKVELWPAAYRDAMRSAFKEGARSVLAHLAQRGTSELRMLTLDELWQLRDRSMEMTGQYELAIQLLFARKNGLPLTAEQSADLDTFLASLAASPQAVQPMPDGGKECRAKKTTTGWYCDCIHPEQHCKPFAASGVSASDGKTQEAPLQAKGKP